LRRKVARLPLRDNVDLYSFILQEPGVWFGVRSVVVRLLEAGKAAVVDTGGNSLQQLYVEHDRQERFVGTTVRLGKKKTSAELLSLVECIAD
jgi:hypothetical protein